ncbi:MAG TPA: ATP-binding protein, partial [Ilumatobacter sp.]|nr:ATP-binding protein [Ilumatobacter sp.]
MSLRARLLAGMAFVAAILAIVATVITISTREQLLDQVDQRLATFAPVAPERGRGGNANDGPLIVPGPDRFSDAYEGLIWPNGELVTLFAPNSSTAKYGAPVVTADDVAGLFDEQPGRTLLFTVPSDDGEHEYRVLATGRVLVVSIVAVPLDDVTDTINRLILVELGGALVILAALGLVSWWVVHLGIRPVKEMTETASRIADGDLAVRIPEPSSGTTTESGALAVALNRMLGHIGDALDERAESEERLRRFVADASHELRTPITTIRGYAELYRHGGLAATDALADAMRRTEQEATRMGRLVEDMLLLAKLDEQRPLEAKPVDVMMLARDAVSDAKASAPDRPIELVVTNGVHADSPVVVLGDEDRLRQVIANVVSNALVHTDPHVAVTVTVGIVDSHATIAVSDSGDGMPAEVTRRVTERFFRADPARSRHRGGSGLGLAIVDAAVTAHGGTV